MHPLATTQRMMTWLCMCPADESTNASRKRAYVAHTLALLFVNLLSVSASLRFGLKFISSDFDGATFAFMIAIAGIGITYFMIVGILMRHQIFDIFRTLSTIYNSHENDIAFHYLVKANKSNEKIWEFFMKYTAVSLIGLIMTCLVSIVYCYLICGHLNIDHFYRPGSYLLPWNQSTYVGYFGEVCFTCAIAYAYIILNWTPLLLFVSICIHHQAFFKMFEHSVDNSKKGDKKMLCNLIRFHVTAKDWFLKSANVYSPFVLVQLICNTVTMTITLFYIDLLWQHMDFIMASVLVTTSNGMSALLVYCYFGQLATESHEMMSDCVYNMNWYEHRIGLQKYFILMIENMQKPIYYHGFEVAKMDLRTFIRLCNKVFSYYMAIKTIASE